MKAQVFSIESKRDDQIKWSKEMTPHERLLLCLDLMDLALAISPQKILVSQNNDSINWIDLKLSNAKSNS